MRREVLFPRCTVEHLPLRELVQGEIELRVVRHKAVGEKRTLNRARARARGVYEISHPSLSVHPRELRTLSERSFFLPRGGSRGANLFRRQIAADNTNYLPSAR